MLAGFFKKALYGKERGKIMNNEKVLTLVGTLGVIILGVIGSLVAWFLGGKDLEGNARETLRQIFNFEISLIIVAFIVGVVSAFIPFVGILVLLLSLANLVLPIMAFIAINNGTEFKAPSFQFVK